MHKDMLIRADQDHQVGLTVRASSSPVGADTLHLHHSQFKILEYKAELTSQKESQRWKLVSAKRQADDVLPPPEIPARQALQKKRKAIKAESAEMGRIQSVEGGFPAGVVIGASKAEVAEDLEAIGKEVCLNQETRKYEGY
jgi:hypothetical protein